MHVTNLQVVLVLFVVSNAVSYVLGLRRGRAA